MENKFIVPSDGLYDKKFRPDTHTMDFRTE